MLPDCGHLSPLEQPAAVEAALRRWREPAPSCPSSLWAHPFVARCTLT